MATFGSRALTNGVTIRPSMSPVVVVGTATQLTAKSPTVTGMDPLEPRQRQQCSSL